MITCSTSFLNPFNTLGYAIVIQLERKKRRKMHISEEDDEQLRRRLKLLTLREMEYENRMRKEAILLSQKRKKHIKNWII
jgi:hypothetical protein